MQKYEVRSAWGVVSGDILHFADSDYEKAETYQKTFEFPSELKEGYAIFTVQTGDLADDTLFEEENYAIESIEVYEEEVKWSRGQ